MPSFRCVHVWATPEQWSAFARLMLLGFPPTENTARRAGFTKTQWRGTDDFKGFKPQLIKAGALVPKGNGPNAGYRLAPWFRKWLQNRGWEQPPHSETVGQSGKRGILSDQPTPEIGWGG